MINDTSYFVLEERFFFFWQFWNIQLRCSADLYKFYRT